MARTQPAPLVLNCLVFGGDVDRLFYVEVTNASTVLALKKAIRNENEHAFREVDAHNLTLWKVAHHTPTASFS
jgi:hypothetical protein